MIVPDHPPVFQAGSRCNPKLIGQIPLSLTQLRLHQGSRFHDVQEAESPRQNLARIPMPSAQTTPARIGRSPGKPESPAILAALLQASDTSLQEPHGRRNLCRSKTRQETGDHAPSPELQPPSPRTDYDGPQARPFASTTPADGLLKLTRHGTNEWYLNHRNDGRDATPSQAPPGGNRVRPLRPQPGPVSPNLGMQTPDVR